MRWPLDRCEDRRVSRDLRICFLGDSFVAGVGDPRCLGWAGRLATAQPLRDNALWRREVRDGDGAHPGAAGYDALAALIMPHWWEWLSR